MNNLKNFSEFINESQSNNSAVNIVVDISGSIPDNLLKNALSTIPFGEFSTMILIACGTRVEIVDTLKLAASPEIFSFVKDTIKSVKRNAGGGSDLQPAIDYIISNKLQKNKTFIISDFEVPDFDTKKLDITKIDCFGPRNESSNDKQTIIKASKDILTKAGLTDADYTISLQGPSVIFSKTGETKLRADADLRVDLIECGIKIV